MHYAFKEIADGSYAAAKVIVPILLKFFPNTSSVVDLGGGLGQWCKAFKENGVNEVLCIDHTSINKNDLLISKNEFLAIDIENNIPNINRKFNLALSIEFAEHIDKQNNNELVHFLTSLSDIIIFSAAIPNQGGIKHINEQRLNYWTKLFQDYDFNYLDLIRPIIINNKEIPFYYRQNLALFIRKDTAKNYTGLNVWNIDPNEFEIVSLNILNKKPGIREAFKMLFNAILKKIIKSK